MSGQKLRRLDEYASPVVIKEDKDYTWVVEVRDLDAAGTPTGDWEVWTAFPAEFKKMPRFPQKHSVLNSYLREVRGCAFDNGQNLEYRIKLACQLTQELDLAATDPPWVAMFADEAEG